jgi:hypothetical protein
MQTESTDLEVRRRFLRDPRGRRAALGLIFVVGVFVIVPVVAMLLAGG